MVNLEMSGRLPRGVTKKFVEKIISAAYHAASGQPLVQVTLSLVSDREIKRLNRECRGVDQTTDVLSFAYSEVDEEFVSIIDDSMSSLLGELVISVSQVQRQAKQIGRSIKDELALMLVHGTLHLMGFDHLTLKDEIKMFSLQQDILIEQGIF